MAVADALGGAAESAGRWRAVRAVLTANRPELGRVAAGLYPDLPRVRSAGLLCREEWLPGAPPDLDDLPVTFDGPAPGGDGYPTAPHEAAPPPPPPFPLHGGPPPLLPRP